MRPPTHVVKTINLPSGKVLEVVHPADGRPYTRLKEVPAQADRDLCLCDACDSDLVEPAEWEAAGPARWRVVLFCPNCERVTEGVFSQESADRFDERLDDGTAAMVADLKRLERANMADDIERFVGALNSDAILPEDF